METRYPIMDFETVEPHWSRNHELAHFYNAASIVPSHIEPYLIRVMLKAQPLIAKRNATLAHDIKIFNQQEVEHCKRHNAFNKVLREKGYPELAEFERSLAADFKHFQETKSLRFNLAYSEGFEAMGSSNAESFFQALPMLERIADPKALELWKWHLAEEFEHRHVCFDVYRTLYGKGLFRGYFYRCYGYLYAYVHLTRFMNGVARYMIDKDRAGMTIEQRAKSENHVKSYRKRARLPSLLKILSVLSPFYDPSHKQPSEAMISYLGSIPAPIKARAERHQRTIRTPPSTA